VHVGPVERRRRRGGVLFDWYVADIGGFTRMFNRLPDWVHYVAALIEQGAYLRRDSDRGPWLLIPDPTLQDAERPQPPEPGPTRRWLCAQYCFE
jgi:hypothetical protein